MTRHRAAAAGALVLAAVHLACAVPACAQEERPKRRDRLRAFLEQRRARRAAAPNSGSPATSSPAASPGDQRAFIRVGDLERTYLLHLPMGFDRSTSYPLVLLLHGGGGDAELAASMSGMSEKADQAGFIAVYPEGAAGPSGLRSWNAGACCAYASRAQVDDVGFIKTLIQRLQSAYPIDPRRIYVTGMSNGAMLAHRLACELSEVFAAAAPVAGTIQVSVCQPSHPVALVAFHGTLDDSVPYNGGQGTGTFTTQNVFQPVEQLTQDWAARNQCQAGPLTERVSSRVNDGVTIDTYTYASCTGGADVRLYRLNGGQHYWPGGQPGRRQESAVPTQAVSATDVIWEFFSQHSR